MPRPANGFCMPPLVTYLMEYAFTFTLHHGNSRRPASAYIRVQLIEQQREACDRQTDGQTESSISPHSAGYRAAVSAALVSRLLQSARAMRITQAYQYEVRNEKVFKMAPKSCSGRSDEFQLCLSPILRTRCSDRQPDKIDEKQGNVILDHP